SSLYQWQGRGSRDGRLSRSKATHRGTERTRGARASNARRLWPAKRRAQQRRASRTWPSFVRFLLQMHEATPELYRRLDRIPVGEVDIELPVRQQIAVTWVAKSFKGR